MSTEQAAGTSIIRSYKASLVPAFDKQRLPRPSNASDPGGSDPTARARLAWLQRHEIAISSRTTTAGIEQAVAAVVDLDTRLWRHHVLTNEAKAACVDWLLTMAAARSVTGPPASRKEACLLVTEWLSVEDAGQASARNLPTVNDTVETFSAHLKACGLDDDVIDQWVAQGMLALKANRRSDAAVVDRRQCYRDLCTSASSLPTYKEDTRAIPMCYQDTIERIGDPEARNVHQARPQARRRSNGAKAKNLNQPARSLVSQRFGAGEGTDHGAIDREFENLHSILQADAPVTQEVLVSARERLSGIRLRGPRPAWMKTLNELVQDGTTPEPERLASLARALDAALKRIPPQGLEKGSKWWTDRLVDAINERLVAANQAHDLGLDDDTTKSLFFGPWKTNGRNEVMLGAMTVFSIRRTKTSTQIDDLISEHDKAQAAEQAMGSDPLWSGLCSYEQMRAPISGGVYRLSDRSCRGFGDLIDTWKGLTAASEVQEATEVLISEGKVAEAVFFRWLTAEITDHGAARPESLGKEQWGERCDAAKESLKVFLDKRSAEDKARRMRMPVLTMPDPLLHPLSALHGENCWSMRAEDDGMVTLGLAAGERVQVRLKSDRYEREIVSPSRRDSVGITAVVRDNHLGRQAAGARQGEKEVYVRVANSSLTINCVHPQRASASATGSQRERRWVGTVPLRLEPKGPLLTWQQASPGVTLRTVAAGSTADYQNWPFQEITPRWRALGVDLGIRIAASWSVLETRPPGKGVPISDRPDLTTLCVAQGQVEHLGEHFTPIRKEKRIVRDLARFIGEPTYSSWDPEPDQYGLMCRAIWLLRSGLRHDSKLMALFRLGRSVGVGIVDDDALYRAWTSRTREAGGADANVYDWHKDMDGAINWQGGALSGKTLVGLATEAWTSYDRRLGEMWEHVEAIVLGTNGHRGISGRGYGQAGDALATLSVIDQWYQVCCARHGRPQPGSPSGRRLPDNFMGSLRIHRANLRSHVSNQIAARLVQIALDHGCHGIVLENLSNYNTESRRTRAENARLRLWGKARVADAVRQACETYGLGFRAVSPFGTSHIDFSNDLEKGVRVEMVDAAELADPEKSWQKEFANAKRNVERHKKAGTTASPYSMAFVALADWIAEHDEHNVLPKKVVVPCRGGHYLASPVDAPARWHDCLAKRTLVDADLNASAVIGWRGLGLPSRGRESAGHGDGDA